jgi:hypothetical protein
MAWHILEHATIGLLVGCALVCIVLPLLWMRGVDPLIPSLWILTISAAFGSAIAIRRRPTLLATAQSIERHIGAPELLSSALLVNADSPFATSLIALADQRASELSLGSLTLRRLGGRAFLGTSLAVAGLLTISVFISAPVTGGENAQAARRNEIEPLAPRTDATRVEPFTSRPDSDPDSADRTAMRSPISDPQGIFAAIDPIDIRNQRAAAGARRDHNPISRRSRILPARIQTACRMDLNLPAGMGLRRPIQCAEILAGALRRMVRLQRRPGIPAPGRATAQTPEACSMPAAPRRTIAT